MLLQGQHAAKKTILAELVLQADNGGAAGCTSINVMDQLCMRRETQTGRQQLTSALAAQCNAQQGEMELRSSDTQP